MTKNHPFSLCTEALSAADHWDKSWQILRDRIYHAPPPPITMSRTLSPDEKIAALLTLRPVDITFEEVPKDAAQTPAPVAPRKRAAPSKSKATAAPAATKPKAGTKAKAPKGKRKGKKADKVTTVRKAFKVQARSVPQQGEQGGGGGIGGVGGGGGGHAVATAVRASSTSAAI